MHSLGRLIATTVPMPAGACLILSQPSAALTGCIVIAAMIGFLALLLLPAVWSGKKYRRDAAYGLVKLIIQSRRTPQR